MAKYTYTVCSLKANVSSCNNYILPSLQYDPNNSGNKPYLFYDCIYFSSACFNSKLLARMFSIKMILN